MSALRPNRRLDLTGQRFGNLVAVRSTGAKRNGVGSILWECVCDCGAAYCVSVDKLRGGNTKRCLRCSQKRLPSGAALYNEVAKQYRGNARRRGYEWNLSKDAAIVLMKQPCAYCGKKPDQPPLASKSYKDTVIHYNGIDRVDNDLGYDSFNCVPCCAQCNWAKSNLAFGAWCDWVARLKANFSAIREMA